VGARGADFSGVRYGDVRLGADSVVGREGEGLELTLRSFQITRAVVPALALGATDTALRTVVRFARERRLYGQSVFDIPRPQATLVDAFADLLACECVVAATARAAHVVPDELRLWSAVSKAFVPVVTGRAIQALGEVLGARSFLRDGHPFAIFQKMARDHDVISLFHAGGFLLLQTVGLGLSQVFGFAQKASTEEKRTFHDPLRRVFSLSDTLPSLDPTRLRPYPRVRGLVGALDELRKSIRHGGVEAEVSSSLATLVASVHGCAVSDMARFETLQATLDANAPELFDLSERYCAIHAATLCAGVWLANREHMDPFLAGGHWLVVALSRIAARLGTAVAVPSSIRDRVRDHLLELDDQQRAFSIVPWRLPDTAR
jgi:hypothetical protein